MKSAYELQALGEMVIAEAKKDGLVIAEEALEKLGKAIYVGSKAWAVESAALSETKIDDFLAPYYGALDPLVLSKIEAIDLDGDGK